MASEPRTVQANAGGLKLFLSYSRRDLEFAEQLVVALETLGHVVTIDRKGIHGAERWEARLGQMILESDTVVFVLSPASAASTVCRWEVDQAIASRKRLVPVLAAPLDPQHAPHEALRDLNYIHFYPDPAFPGTGWGSGLARLDATLSVDIDWIREHTRVLEVAVRWQAEFEAADFLARGSELDHLRRWRDSRPANAPELTASQRAYLQASESAEAMRLDVERRQLDDMRAAQQARAAALEASGHAQDERAQALKTVVRRTVAGIAVAAALSIAVGIAAIAAYRNGERARLALAQIQDERELQDRLIRLARNRDFPPPPYQLDILARRYEGESADHVGTDFLGGVYYGIFRIKAGTAMDDFLAFLQRWAPELQAPLAEAGGSTAASAQDARFIAAWRVLATDPATGDRFSTLQTDFITRQNYSRLASQLAPSGPGAFGLDLTKHTLALRAVIYSVAVQYGPSTMLVRDALAPLGDLSRRTDADLIPQIYLFRDQVDRYFPGIRARSPNFAELIRERNQWEQKDALLMLAREVH